MDDQAKRQQILDKLRQERDEIRLRLHLGKADLKDEWAELEKKLKHLEARVAEAAESARQGARKTSREVGATFGVLSEELGEAYRRIRSRLR